MRWRPNRCSCGTGVAPETLFAVADVNLGTVAESATLMRCPACGGLFPDRVPAPGSVAEAYGRYYTLAEGDAVSWVRSGARALLDRSRQAYLGREVPGGAARVLDFGCGSGAWLRALRRRRPGTHLFGTDLAGPAGDAEGFHWLSPDTIETAAPFDWITLGHVLEHHPDPPALIRRLAACLAPGGGMWIATPSAGGFLIAAAGPWARDIDFPRHREILSRAGLAGLVAGAGLAATFRSPPRINAVLNALHTLGLLCRNRGLGPRQRVVLTGSILTRLLVHVVAPGTSQDRVSPELVVVCRKLPG